MDPIPSSTYLITTIAIRKYVQENGSQAQNVQFLEQALYRAWSD